LVKPKNLVDLKDHALLMPKHSNLAKNNKCGNIVQKRKKVIYMSEYQKE